MRFVIRFAEQIVGALIIASLGALVLVVVLLGGRQRWFAKDYLYTTYLDSAAGLSRNMAVSLRGFTIGNVRAFDLTAENRVRVIFSVYDTYQNRVREGSVVELAVSPIGLGNHFYFHPGRGERLLEERELIPAVHSPEARELQARGLAVIPKQDDSITLITGRVNILLEDLDRTVLLLQEALAGTGSSSLGRIVQEVEGSAAGTKRVLAEAERALGDLPAVVEEFQRILRRDIEPVLADIRTITGELADPGNLLLSTLEGEGPLYGSLDASLNSIAGILKSLDKTAAMLPPDMVQAAALLAELRAALGNANDVLVALTNNPLLKKGVPQPVRAEPSGLNPRDISF
jgi:phospholipid/cholesterol/gamma-HCH transport system substrate-binding protein